MSDFMHSYTLCEFFFWFSDNPGQKAWNKLEKFDITPSPPYNVEIMFLLYGDIQKKDPAYVFVHRNNIVWGEGGVTWLFHDLLSKIVWKFQKKT